MFTNDKITLLRILYLLIICFSSSDFKSKSSTNTSQILAHVSNFLLWSLYISRELFHRIGYFLISFINASVSRSSRDITAWINSVLRTWQYSLGYCQGIRRALCVVRGGPYRDDAATSRRFVYTHRDRPRPGTSVNGKIRQRGGIPSRVRVSSNWQFTPSDC